LQSTKDLSKVADLAALINGKNYEQVKNHIKAVNRLFERRLKAEEEANEKSVVNFFESQVMFANNHGIIHRPCIETP